MKAISILGCGWLGLPLAQKLIASGFSVKGSTTSTAKLPVLEAAGIKAYLIRSGPPLKGVNLLRFFQSDVLFLNIPFKRALTDPHVYQQQVQEVVDHVVKSSIRFVIFASSTAIYPDELVKATEETTFTADGPRAKVLVSIEQMLLKQKEFQTTIIRFGGLYGHERRIGQRLISQKPNLLAEKADGPVNLIHLDDCIEIITKIITLDIRGEVFNAVSDGHPTRRELYSRVARQHGLPLPAFDEAPAGPTKTVDNAKLKERLHFQFKFPDPLLAVDQL